jgi:hypothetical protein
MIKLALLLIITSPAIAETEALAKWPTYCIRSVEENSDGTYLLDMPGWPYGMDDRPFLVTTLQYIDETPQCTPDDPRMR